MKGRPPLVAPRPSAKKEAYTPPTTHPPTTQPPMTVRMSAVARVGVSVALGAVYLWLLMLLCIYGSGLVGKIRRKCPGWGCRAGFDGLLTFWSTGICLTTRVGSTHEVGLAQTQPDAKVERQTLDDKGAVRRFQNHGRGRGQHGQHWRRRQGRRQRWWWKEREK